MLEQIKSLDLKFNLKIEQAGLGAVPEKKPERKQTRHVNPRETAITLVENAGFDQAQFNCFAIDNLPSGSAPLIVTTLNGKTLLMLHKSIQPNSFKVPQ